MRLKHRVMGVFTHHFDGGVIVSPHHPVLNAGLLASLLIL